MAERAEYANERTSIHRIAIILASCVGFCCTSVGCGGDAPPATAPPSSPVAPPAFTSAPARPAPTRPADVPADSPRHPTEPDQPRRNLGQLLNGSGDSPEFVAPEIARMSIDDAKVRSRGIRKLSSRHLDLYTDLPSSPAVDELPQIFDLAVPQWAEYFEVAEEKAASFKMIGFLMDEPNTFRAAGLLPDSLPEFPNGFQLGWEFWVHEQKEDYYRRHLLLHEGTHGFMNMLLGGSGPPWYSEGMAELFGTHQWQEGSLKLRYNPQDKTETPDWGRVKLVREEYAANRGMTLPQIMRYDSRAHLRTEPYAWCWAACHFLELHPHTQKSFLALREKSNRPTDFSSRFHEQLLPHWSEINEQWQIYVAELDYGYDLERAIIQHHTGDPQPVAAAPGKAVIQADHGWQSTGLLLAAGATYRITAAGTFRLADEPKPWVADARGVTIHYHDGAPLGLLVGALRDPSGLAEGGVTPLLQPQRIGVQRDITPRRDGVLYLRINESAASLKDNQGQLQIQVERI